MAQVNDTKNKNMKDESDAVLEDRNLESLSKKGMTELSMDEATGVSQEKLEYVSKHFPDLKDLSVRLEYDDDAPVLSFSELFFPKLQSLSLDCVGLRSLHFEKENYPCLERISVENTVGDVQYMRLDLPTLKSFGSQFLTIDDASGFAPSLSRCTSLESFCGYKLWGLSSSTCNKLYLPNCEYFDIYRSDDLEHLELYAPKLVDLNLQACYSLSHVRIVEEPFGRRVKCFCCGKEETDKDSDKSVAGETDLKHCTRCRIAQYCSKECQEKHWGEHKANCGKKIEVNLVNANIDSVSLQLLKKHPRIRRIRRNPNNLFF